LYKQYAPPSCWFAVKGCASCRNAKVWVDRFHLHSLIWQIKVLAIWVWDKYNKEVKVVKSG